MPRAKVLIGPALAVLSCATPLAAQTCEAPELIDPSHPEYATLVCSSIVDADKGDFAEAAEQLERALDLWFHEYPNYRALPRMALYYARLGATSEAEATLEEARLALSIILGFMNCVSDADGFHLETREARVRSPAVPAVVQRMCGEAYDSFYAQTDLRSIRRDLPLLEIYYRAADLVSRE